LMGAGEAACYFHGTRRAEVACEVCGRLICGLCDLELGGRHVCPACLPELEKRGRLETLERGRTRYDALVWTLLLLPLIALGFAGLVTGPMAFGLAIWKWRAPPSRVDRTRLRLALALPVAVAEFGLGVWLWSTVLIR
jgi:hypothetical protein